MPAGPGPHAAAAEPPPGSARALRAVFRRGGPDTLRIVTCGPPYVASRGGYQDNVIVTALRERRALGATTPS